MKVIDLKIRKYIVSSLTWAEGNVCSTRIWLDHILKKKIHLVVDWSKDNKEDYLQAMERSPIKDVEIKHLLKGALTDRIDDREIINGYRNCT